MLANVIRKLHTYAGLLTFVNLVIYGTVVSPRRSSRLPARPLGRR